MPQDDELLIRLGRNIHRWRTERGLSQEQLAEHIGVHRTYAGGLERGERNLSLRTLTKLAAQLELDPLELLK